MKRTKEDTVSTIISTHISRLKAAIDSTSDEELRSKIANRVQLYENALEKRKSEC